MSLTYQKINLFEAPKGELLVHACNSQGVWGAGIAAQFVEHGYRGAYRQYLHHCRNAKGHGKNLLGTALLCHQYGADHPVGCLFTSNGFGYARSSEEDILIFTAAALNDLCRQIWDAKKLWHPRPTVYSNKFNSGLFGVDWNETQIIIQRTLADFPEMNWIVCDPNLEE